MSHWIHEFQSEYSIFTNFKRDHQNWHRDMQEYLDAKMHLVARTTRMAVINAQILDFAKENTL
jgi:UDP-N-acetylmuramoylalanine-D-glutamate ligase